MECRRATCTSICVLTFARSPGRHAHFIEVIAVPVVVAAALVLGGCKSIPAGRSSVNEVKIRGADKLDEDDIEDAIATSESPKFLRLFRGIFEYSLFDRFVLQRDLERVEAFYRSKGYYDVHARAGRVLTVDDKHVRIEIIVEEGTVVVIHEVRVEGLGGLPSDVADAARIAAADGLVNDQPFEGSPSRRRKVAFVVRSPTTAMRTRR